MANFQATGRPKVAKKDQAMMRGFSLYRYQLDFVKSHGGSKYLQKLINAEIQREQLQSNSQHHPAPAQSSSLVSTLNSLSKNLD